MIVSRRSFLRASVVTGSMAAVTACSRRAGAPRGEAQSAWEDGVSALEARIPNLMNTLHVPGVAVALIRDARIAWTRSFGARDASTRAPVDENTVFSGQSMSKPVFAYRVL